jgi:hypothetical protein
MNEYVLVSFAITTPEYLDVMTLLNNYDFMMTEMYEIRGYVILTGRIQAEDLSVLKLKETKLSASQISNQIPDALKLNAKRP